MNCTKPVLITKNLPVDKYPDGILVPCGKCLLCRITKRKEWTLRLIHEMKYFDDTIFVTLTYDDEHIPAFGSLVKSDLQKFFKRLRKRLKKRKIKYYAVGEYGDLTFRPHYHAIIFGLSLNNDDLQMIKDSWPLCDWNSPVIGKKSFGYASLESIQYTTKYLHKKFSGEMEEREYKDFNLETPFKIGSNGLGKRFAIDNRDNINERLHFTLRGNPQSIPRYYLKFLDIDPELLKQMALLNQIDEVEKFSGFKLNIIDLYKQLPEKYAQLYEKRLSCINLKEKNVEALNKIRQSKKM